MNDTKSLDRILATWNWLETILGAWHFQGIPPLKEASSELANLKESYRQVVECRSKAVFAYNNAVNDAKKVITTYIRSFESELSKADALADEWLLKYSNE